MKPSTYALRFALGLALVCGLFFLHSSPAKVDSINFLNDFRNSDPTGTMTGIFNVLDGSLDYTIDEAALNSLKVTRSVPNNAGSFYRKNPRDVRDAFSYDQPSNVEELGLESGTSEALINFIVASAF